jgi:hypothetical protein
MIARLIVTAAPGTPTGELVMTIEQYDPDTGTWSVAATADPISAAGTVELGVADEDLSSDVVRIVVNGSNAQSYTYSATSERFISAGAGYEPPSLTELRTKVLRSLQDPDGEAFNPDEINDFINDAIAEVNQIRPREALSAVTDVATLDALGMTYVWKVEVVDYVGGSTVLPPNNDETRYANGWVLYANRLIFPQKYIDWLTTNFADGRVRLDVYGYSVRDPLVSDEQVGDFDLLDEQLVLRYAMLRGYRALLADRALFQQWQAQSNNTDVSPTQLTNMAQVAEAEWGRNRSRSYVIRRPPVGW